MNDRQNRRPQIAAATEHIQPDPVAAAYDKLKAALAAGSDDPAARTILQAALPAAVDAAAAPTGADIAEGLRSEHDVARGQVTGTDRLCRVDYYGEPQIWGAPTIIPSIDKERSLI